MKNSRLIIIFLLLVAGTSYYFFDLNTYKPDPKKIFKTSGALKAMQFMNMKRSYPGTDIPSDGYQKAYDYSRLTFDKSANKLTTYTWEQIGPHNIGGRTLDVEFNPQNPNTIFAGAASGGLWRSYTGGLGAMAWERIETGFPMLGVSSIAIQQSDSNTIYIGTGEVYNYQMSLGGEVIRTTRGSYGIGILKSTDYGNTWIKSLDWSYNQERGVNEVEIDPNNSSIIWAATSEGIFKSTNAGATWNISNNVLMGFDIAINPLNSNIVYVSHGNLGSVGHGIYRTTNGGTNWTKLTNGLPLTFGGKAIFSMYKTNPQIIYVSIGNGDASGAGTWLCKTTNGGDNWTIVNTTDYATYQGWYSHWVGVHPTNPDFLLTGGIDIYKSTNGGTNLNIKTDWAAWYFGVTIPGEPEGPSDYVHADQHSVTFHPTNPNIIYFGTDGGVFRTTDGGETFGGCNGGYQSTQFYNGFSSSFQTPNLGIGGLQDNATAIFEGTVAWRRVIGGDGCQTGINAANENILYGTSQYLNLLRSTNRGLNWSGITPGGRVSPAFVAPFIICQSNPSVIYAGSKVFHRSTNSGSSWTLGNGGVQLDGNEILAIGVSATSTDTVYVGTAPTTTTAHVFRSTNGGSTFTNITGIIPDRYIDDIAVDPSDSKVVYVVVSGFGTSHLFKSTNAGNDWIDIGSTLPDVPSSAIVVNPFNTQQLFFGNDIGVYFSPDAGLSWYEYMIGLPQSAMIMDLSIVRSDNRIRAATHGNGVYEADIENLVPVELASFSAEVRNEKVILRWSTATELNNNGFEVQRSGDGKNFFTISFVEGNGTSTETNNYTYEDNNVNGRLFYRLKQVDFSGRYSYSNIIEVNAIALNDFVLEQNYPNPFNPSTIISYNLIAPSVITLKVFNANGEEIKLLESGLKQTGKHSVRFEDESLSSGIYFYSLTGKNQNSGREFSITKKMLLIK
ncbi:MAG: T9SS type A sorting domain-containing protein [Ignavibacteriales bacterium]|nr:MAG: T9SS type A sorting domain-containing protein [Ignavibacteriales bacterium]